MGEPCRRVRFADVKAVEPAEELAYKKRLLAFLATMKKKEKQQRQQPACMLG